MLVKVSLYLLGCYLFLFFGALFFLSGIYFFSFDYVIFMDWEFFSINSSSFMMTFLLDWMSLIFVGCVFMISSMVIYYSEEYMSSDFDSIRFYFLVFLFIMSMMMMIVSPNLMSILIGWDGLGLVSYCLVIYFQNFKSYVAGMLTVLTNRIGDVAILLAIAWMINFGGWHYIFYLGISEDWLVYLFLLIVLAGFTSSAQIPFSSWLPAAMAAPTPVSSLVHSSTLVTAGVYLLIRFFDFLCMFNCSLFLFISSMTMFMAGVGANLEFDLKKVIALSTLSQLGLMMTILFMGYPILSFFHLLTHAFFKALLFLCAGLLIHCMNSTQDVRCMGSVVNYLPFTCSCFCISNLSLCGLPFMSGFYSKDMILEIMSLSYNNLFIYLVFYVSVGLTVSYSVRLVYYCLFCCTNSYVCQGYSEDRIMINSMVMLTMFSIFMGSLLGWILLKCPDLIVLSFSLKMFPLLLIFLGGWIGYELSNYYVISSLFSFRFYFMSTFLGSMWFMPSFSTYMLSDFFFFISSVYFETMDGGWGEYYISKSSYLYSSFISKLMNYYQFNNLKIFMLGFILFIFVYFI